MKLKTKSFLLSLSFVFPFLVGCNGEQQTSTDVSSTDTTIITTSTFSQTSTNPADENVEGFDYYLLDDGTYCIAQGTSTLLSEITIPSLYKGRNVTQIKEEGFAGHNATTINLPNTITTICDKAFQNCSSLVSISISENICHFGNGVFNGCNNLQHNIYNNARYLGNSSNPYIILCKNLHAGITFCEIYNSCRIIYEKAFASCTSLTSIQIPDKIKSIGENAFYNCSSLKSIIIPENVVSIGKRIFEQCSFELKIYCAVEEKPSEWSDEWNSVNGMIWIGLTPLFSYLTLWGYRQIIVNEGYSYAIVEKNGTQTATIISFDEQITSFNPQSEINGIKVTQFIFYYSNSRRTTQKSKL